MVVNFPRCMNGPEFARQEPRLPSEELARGRGSSETSESSLLLGGDRYLLGRVHDDGAVLRRTVDAITPAPVGRSARTCGEYHSRTGWISRAARGGETRRDKALVIRHSSQGVWVRVDDC